MTRDEEIKLYQRIIEGAKEKIARLEAQYQGVRPSWVSGDIGWLHVDIERFTRLIHQLQQEDGEC